MMRASTGTKLSVLVPCYNEEKTLKECINRVREISDDHLSIEIIIVDDCSTDNSYSIARELESQCPEIKVFQHQHNSGKGAALRTGIKYASGDFVAVQDADLEYDPHDLKRLLKPLVEGKADVILGSRFLSTGVHRVLYFWHSIGNRFLTLFSNMFTDLNLTDMETCYKVFRKDVIQAIDIQENRFGFEPEIVAKVAHMRLRIYEMGISYYGRTYAEGKKIGVKDGFRALYCIFRYNAHRAPLPMQLLLYLHIGAAAAVVNLSVFYFFICAQTQIIVAAPAAFLIAAAANYVLCIKILFRHEARWNSKVEILVYLMVVSFACLLDLAITKFFISINLSAVVSKLFATIIVFMVNFLGRRFIVFPEPTSGEWNKQIP